MIYLVIPAMIAALQVPVYPLPAKSQP